MILTEKEAGDKWCPMIRSSSDNRDLAYPCIGSRCMAWRWAMGDEFASMPASALGFCGLSYAVRMP